MMEQQFVTPTVDMLKTSLPDMDDYFRLASMGLTFFGYAFCGICWAIVIVFVLYIFLSCAEAAVTGYWPFKHGGGWPIPTLPCCGFCIPMMLSAIMPAIIFISVLLFLVSGVASNEVCRYITNPSAVNVTDAILNLYLKSKWQSLLPFGTMDPAFKDVLDLPAPRNILHGLLFNCTPSAANQYTPPLFPILGIDNAVHIEAILASPDIVKAIDDTETNMVTTIKGFNLAQVFPANMPALYSQLSDAETKLSQLNLQNYVTDISTRIPKKTDIEQKLTSFETAIASMPVNTALQTAASNIRAQLSNLDVLDVKIDGLKATIATLESFKTLPLSAFSGQLKQLYNTLTTDTLLVQPVKTVFRSEVSALFSKLKSELGALTKNFTADIVSCTRLSYVVKTSVGMACGSEGLISNLGAFMLLLLLISFTLLGTIFIFDIFLGLHSEQRA